MSKWDAFKQLFRNFVIMSILRALAGDRKKKVVAKFIFMCILFNNWSPTSLYRRKQRWIRAHCCH